MRRLAPFLLFLVAAVAGPVQAQYYPSLRSYLDTDGLPGEVLSPGEGETEESLLDRIGVKDFNYAEITEGSVDVGATINGAVVIKPAEDGTTGLALAIPGIDAFELVTGLGEVSFSMTARETQTGIPATDYPFVLTVNGIELGLRLKGNFLQPAEQQPDMSYTLFDYDEAAGHFVDGIGQPVFVEFTTTADLTIRYTWDGETEFDIAAAGGGGTASFSASHPMMIAGTGIVMNVRGATLDLSTSNSPPSAPNAAWQGLLIDELAVAFTGALDTPDIDSDPAATPPDFASLTLSGFQIGTGGFSGTIAGNLGAGASTDLAGMGFLLQTVSVGFQQNALTSAAVGGTIDSFPFFDTPLKLDLSFDLDGNFRAGIAGDDPNRDGDLVAWEIQDVARLEVDSVAFQLQEEVFYIEANGGLVPLFFDGDVSTAAGSDPRIPLNGLRVGSDGSVALQGGWVTLPEKRHIDFNAFKVELSQFGFGAVEPGANSRWIGFSGGVELVEGLSAQAKFKELKVTWTEAVPGAEVTLSGVEAAYEQPGVLAFRGAVDWFDDGSMKGFAGAINAELQFIKTSLDARLVIGETIADIAASSTGSCNTLASSERFKFFYIDVGAQLPAGIPVFSGVSLYGLEGLLALHMEPNLCAFDKPLDWYDAHRTATNVVAGSAASPAPWLPRSQAFAVGLGVVLGTTPDDGFAVNGKVALTVAVPGPVVMLTGQGNVLKQRGSLNGTDQPLFTAIAVFDGRELEFLMNLGIYYKLPDNGLLYDITATGEAFFDLREPQNWHLYMGKDQPESERITAKMLGIFVAQSYHMLENDQTKLGAKAGYDSRPNWKFGPLRVTFGAWAGFDTAVSWRPVHAWGAIDLGGIAELKAFGFGIGLSTSALLEAETPTPFEVAGQFKVKLNLPWPLPDPKATVKFHWSEPGEIDPVEDWVQAVTLEDSKSTGTLASPLDSPPPDETNNTLNLPVCPAEEFLPDALRDEANPLCVGPPMVELTYRPVVAFKRDANENLPFSDDQVQLVPEEPGHYADDFGDGRQVSYALNGLRLLAAERTNGANSVTFGADAPMENVYGAWPALLGLGGQPSALYVRLWSKNPFSAYDASSYQFHDGNGDGVPDEGWEEWFSGLYGEYPCPQDGILFQFGDATKASPRRCAPPELYTEEDLILPPYHAFALDVEGSGNGSGANVNSATYDRYAYFFTEGPPLALDPFVFETLPRRASGAPHYRDYAVGLRFNETYLDLLYKDPGPLDANSMFKDPAQLFTIDLTDENGAPVVSTDGDPFVVDTTWEQAPNHISTRSEEAWIDLMVAAGTGIDTGLIPTDDVVYGQPTRPEVMRPGQRYTARFWLEDPRLEDDRRVTSDAWKAAMGVRFAEGDTAMLYSFSFVASAYRSFSDLMGSYGGAWFAEPAASFPANVEILALSAFARATDGAAAAGNGDAGYLGRSMARLVPGRRAEEFTGDAFVELLQRVPNYVGDHEAITEAQVAAVRTAWSEETKAFDEIDAAMGLDRLRQPLPEEVEISVIQQGGAVRALLLEAPEPIDWIRVAASLRRQFASGLPQSRDLAVVPDATGARVFVFDVEGGAVNDLPDATYRLQLTYLQEIGPRNPVLVAAEHPVDETVELTIAVPLGQQPSETP